MRYLAMIVDDQLSEVRLLQSILHSRGFEVVIANSPEEATRVLRSSYPHLLLVDIMLGENVSGLDWLKEIRQGRFRNIPAIIMTGSSARQDLNSALGLGIEDYILKPADFNVLSKKLFRITEKLEKEPVYRFQPEEKQKFTISATLPATISGISEVGLAISSFLSSPEPTEEVGIETKLFEEIAIPRPVKIALLNRESETSAQQLGYPFRVYCQAKGWKNEDRLKLRHWIRDRDLKRAF